MEEKELKIYGETLDEIAEANKKDSLKELEAIKIPSDISDVHQRGLERAKNRCIRDLKRWEELEIKKQQRRGGDLNG